MSTPPHAPARPARDVDPATGPAALLVLAMLADARLPTGAHAHSAGLEPAVQAGLLTTPRGGSGPEDLTRVPALARTRLLTVTATEAGAAVVARHVWLDRGDLGPVEDAWAARTPSPAVRDAARRLGRGYLRLALALWPDALAGAFAPRAAPPRPLVAGAIGAVTGLDALQVALLVGYDDVQTIASAALKLAPLDPATTTRWVLDLHPDVAAMAQGVAHLTDPDDIPSAGAPMTDAWAQAHARTTRRLFHG
ncbi:MULTISPECIES: urease accessory protein UreF [Cellulomonas]|nr:MULTISPECIES: urease accessory UreF family protein [Cellulomonas]